MSNFKNILMKKVEAKKQGDKLNITEIPLSKLKENPYQPRIEINEKELQELANSIQEQGLIQPISVTPIKNEEGYFYIIAGHRRVEAHRILGKQTIKVNILNDINEKELASLSISENWQRKNLNIIETAIALKEYKEKFSKSYDEIAKELGKSKSLIIKMMNILNLPQEIISDIKTNQSTKDLTALSLINAIPKKVSMLTPEQIKNSQIELYKGFLENGRNWLKQKLNELYSSKEKNIYLIKNNSKYTSIKINKRLTDEATNQLKILIENFLQNLGDKI